MIYLLHSEYTDPIDTHSGKYSSMLVSTMRSHLVNFTRSHFGFSSSATKKTPAMFVCCISEEQATESKRLGVRTISSAGLLKIVNSRLLADENKQPRLF